MYATAAYRTTVLEVIFCVHFYTKTVLIVPFSGGVYKIMTKEGDNDVRWSSVQGGRERTGGVSDPLPVLQETAFGL